MGIGFFQDLPFSTCTNVQIMHVHICIRSEDFAHVQIMHVHICIRSEDFVHVQIMHVRICIRSEDFVHVQYKNDVHIFFFTAG